MLPPLFRHRHRIETAALRRAVGLESSRGTRQSRRHTGGGFYLARNRSEPVQHLRAAPAARCAQRLLYRRNRPVVERDWPITIRFRLDQLKLASIEDVEPSRPTGLHHWKDKEPQLVDESGVEQ